MENTSAILLICYYFSSVLAIGSFVLFIVTFVKSLNVIKNIPAESSQYKYLAAKRTTAKKLFFLIIIATLIVTITSATNSLISIFGILLEIALMVYLLCACISLLRSLKDAQISFQPYVSDASKKDFDKLNEKYHNHFLRFFHIIIWSTFALIIVVCVVACFSKFNQKSTTGYMGKTDNDEEYYSYYNNDYDSDYGYNNDEESYSYYDNDYDSDYGYYIEGYFQEETAAEDENLVNIGSYSFHLPDGWQLLSTGENNETVNINNGQYDITISIEECSDQNAWSRDVKEAEKNGIEEMVTHGSEYFSNIPSKVLLFTYGSENPQEYCYIYTPVCENKQVSSSQCVSIKIVCDAGICEGDIYDAPDVNDIICDVSRSIYSFY